MQIPHRRTSGCSAARPLIPSTPSAQEAFEQPATPWYPHRHRSNNITRSTTVPGTRSQQSQLHDRMEGSAAAGGRIAPMEIYPVDSGQRIFQNEQKPLTSQHEYNRKEESPHHGRPARLRQGSHLQGRSRHHLLVPCGRRQGHPLSTMVSQQRQLVRRLAQGAQPPQ